DAPAFNKLSRRGKVCAIAFRRARIDPADDRLYLPVAEPPIVGKFANLRLGVPWRHSTRQDLFANRPRPRAHLFEVHEGHRRDLTRAMAGLTALLKNRYHVFAKRRRLLLSSLGPTQNR